MTHIPKIADRLAFDSPETLQQQFPELADALQEKIEVELNAGEALFIPPYVWHYVHNFGSGMYFLENCSLKTFEPWLMISNRTRHYVHGTNGKARNNLS
jgi:hypothetical protein